MRLALFGVLVVFAALLLSGCTEKKNCGTNAGCFTTAIRSCSTATFSEDLSGGSAIYEVVEKKGTDCKVTMKLVSGIMTRSEKTYLVPSDAEIKTENTKMNTALFKYAKCASDFECVDGLETCVSGMCAFGD